MQGIGVSPRSKRGHIDFPLFHLRSCHTEPQGNSSSFTEPGIYCEIIRVSVNLAQSNTVTMQTDFQDNVQLESSHHSHKPDRYTLLLQQWFILFYVFSVYTTCVSGGGQVKKNPQYYSFYYGELEMRQAQRPWLFFFLPQLSMYFLKIFKRLNHLNNQHNNFLLQIPLLCNLNGS